MNLRYCSNCGVSIENDEERCPQCRVYFAGKGVGSEEERRQATIRYRKQRRRWLLQSIGDSAWIKNWKEINYIIPSILLVLATPTLFGINWLLLISGIFYISLLAGVFFIVDVPPPDLEEQGKIRQFSIGFGLSILGLSICVGIVLSVMLLVRKIF